MAGGVDVVVLDRGPSKHRAILCRLVLVGETTLASNSPKTTFRSRYIHVTHHIFLQEDGQAASG